MRNWGDAMTHMENTMREVIPAVGPSAEERRWAAIAHASSLLTLLVSLATVGIGGVFFVLIPLAIYLSFRDKSEYVAFHAAQAVAIQLVGSVGLLLGLIAGALLVVLLWALVGLLSIILVGLVLIPVALVVTLALVLLALLAPFVLGGFSLVAAIQTGGGEDYDYPYIGRLVRSWLARTATPSTPQV